MHETQAPVRSLPWWKFGHVWLVIAGPVIVVIAGFITLWLAIRAPDPVVTSEEYRQGLESHKALAVDAPNLAPAVQARNHAQTGVPVAPATKP
jgi:hypothetical protein